MNTIATALLAGTVVLSLYDSLYSRVGQVRSAPSEWGVTQADVLSSLTGLWQLENTALGSGIISARFDPKARHTKISRRDTTLSFTVTLEVDHGSNGDPVYAKCSISLAKGAGGGYRLSIESKSWLQLTALALLVEGDSLLAGTGALHLGPDSLSLSVKIRINGAAGHSWEITALGSDNRARRGVWMDFIPVTK
jgi:hypothetical protein